VPIPETPQLEKRLYREDVYTTLKNWIVHGDLKPLEKIRDADLAAQLGVSRTPVREALRRLEDEGLIETKLNAWTRVAGVDLALAERVYPILKLLEPLALELSAPYLKAKHFKEMRQLNRAVQKALKAGDAVNAAMQDADLHDVFMQHCQNPELAQIIRTLKTNHIRLEIHYWRGGSVALESVTEHEEMIAALESGETKKAKQALEHNWIRALDRLKTRARA
jgi:DNA-binding GntR family transcriptional regulator